MTGTRFRHADGINLRKPQELRGGTAKRNHGEEVPWSAGFAKRVYDGEWSHVLGQSGSLVAAIDDPSEIVLSKPRVLGMIEVVPPTSSVLVSWFDLVHGPLPELHMLFADVDKFSLGEPGVPRSLDGLDPEEREANAGRLRLTHVRYRYIGESNNSAANWIINGKLKVRRQSSVWTVPEDPVEELTDYEDYGLVPDDLWFDYPEFDRYDHLIFRDSPALRKLGVPAEIRLKPVPAMPPEVDG